MAAGRILVTGGTGMVGGAIVEHLPELEVVCVTRSAGDGSARASSASSLVRGLASHRLEAVEVRHDALRHVAGDLTKPFFGLPEDEFQTLAGGLDAVVHCAGVTDFTTHRRRTYAINLEGTRHAIELARRADCRLFHVSTAYVEADGETVDGKWGAGVYIGSKREAEQLVRDSGLPATIVRPTIAFGDSRTGAAPSFQGLHRLLGQILGANIPLLPVPPLTRVDFLPRDVMGREIARVVRDGLDGEHWITAGESAMTFERVVELVIEHGRGLGLAPKAPRFVEREMVERLLRPAFEEEIGRKIDLLIALTAHFDPSGATLPCTVDNSELDIEEAFVRSIEFWSDRNGIAELSEARA